MPPIKPIAVMPAATLADTPTGESSTTRHAFARTFSFSAVCRYRSGAGFAFLTSLAQKRLAFKKRISPVHSRVIRMRSRDEDDATHFGPRSHESAYSA